MTAPYLPVRVFVDTPDLADDPDIFPLLPGQTFVAQKAPVFATTVKTSKSGREFRNAEQSTPRWKFRVAYEVLRQKPALQEQHRLFAFFNAHYGRLGEFYYYDPTDHACVDEFVGYGDGMTVGFQLQRSVATWRERVLAVYGIPVVKVNGTPTTAFTLNPYGRITLTTPPPAGQTVTWTGDFMYLCRFDQDELSTAQMVQRMWSNDGLSFISLKP